MNSWHAELNGSWKIEVGKTLSGKLYYYDNARYLPGPVIYYVNKSNEHLREKNFFGQLQFKGNMSSVLSLLALGKFNWATSRYTDFGGSIPTASSIIIISKEKHMRQGVFCILRFPIFLWIIPPTGL